MIKQAFQVLDEITTLIGRINKQTELNPNKVHVDDLIDVSIGSIINSLMFG
jgi:hypothetical protein